MFIEWRPNLGRYSGVNSVRFPVGCDAIDWHLKSLNSQLIDSVEFNPYQHAPPYYFVWTPSDSIDSIECANRVNAVTETPFSLISDGFNISSCFTPASSLSIFLSQSEHSDSNGGPQWKIITYRPCLYILFYFFFPFFFTVYLFLFLPLPELFAFVGRLARNG